MKLVLIDYENVQPETINILLPEESFVVVCVGVKQKMLPLELVKSLIHFGQNCQIIESYGVGKNALDFIIIDTMARITTERHFDELYIVSKDKGFDSIISHYLTLKRVAFAKRVDDIEELNSLRVENNVISDRLSLPLLTSPCALIAPNPTKVSSEERSYPTSIEQAILKVQQQLIKISVKSIHSIPKTEKSRLNWIKNELKEEDLSDKQIKFIMEQVNFPENTLISYIKRAVAHLQTIEKKHYPKTLEKRINWLKNFFKKETLSEQNIKEIALKVFK
jgi:NACalpha-BTF3-like transcription factor